MLSFLLSNKYLAIAKWIAIAGLVVFVFHEWDKIQGYDQIKKEKEQAIADHNAYIATRAKQDAITAKVSTDYENAIQDLTGQLDAARSAVPVIRVCRSVPKSSATSSAPSESNGASKDGSSGPHEELVETVSTDEPLNIAGEAAKCGERLNALQKWVTDQYSLAKPAGSP